MAARNILRRFRQRGRHQQYQFRDGDLSLERIRDSVRVWLAHVRPTAFPRFLRIFLGRLTFRHR